MQEWYITSREAKAIVGPIDDIGGEAMAEAIRLIDVEHGSIVNDVRAFATLDLARNYIANIHQPSKAYCAHNLSPSSCITCNTWKDER